ncbi:MAG: ATP-binding protein [Rhizobium sp.]|nr:ATP-binding protein [Rhizobium sp.]
MHDHRFHRTAFQNAADRAEAASSPVLERQMMIKNLLFEYPQFQSVIGNVAKFHIPVEDTGLADIGVVGGVMGESRAGKSKILESYSRRFPSVVEDDIVTYPVVYIEARADWDSLEFARQIFRATGKQYVPRAGVAAMNTAVTLRLRDHRTTLLIVDDSHFIFDSKRTRKTNVSLIKEIVDAQFCNVLLAGLPSIETAVEHEAQLRGRGGFPRFDVKAFNTKTKAGRDNYRLFLHGIDQRLPFAESSDLASKAFSDELRRMSNGSVGLTMNVVRAAALMALNAGTRRVLGTHLRAAAEQRALLDRTRPGFGEEGEGGVDVYA